MWPICFPESPKEIEQGKAAFSVKRTGMTRRQPLFRSHLQSCDASRASHAAALLAKHSRVPRTQRLAGLPLRPAANPRPAPGQDHPRHHWELARTQCPQAPGPLTGSLGVVPAVCAFKRGLRGTPGGEPRSLHRVVSVSARTREGHGPQRGRRGSWTGSSSRARNSLWGQRLSQQASGAGGGAGRCGRLWVW